MATVPPSAIVLALYSLLHPVAFTARGVECRTLPPNIQVERELRPIVTQLLARSRTLRAQCVRIAASPPTHVAITLSMSPMDATTRARSYARRYDSGLVVVEVQIPPASRDFAELLAHELEHVTELIDGIDFRALAAARGSAVQDRADGSFESDRARDAGIRAAAEVAAETDRPAAAAAGAVRRALGAVVRFARGGLRR